MNFFNATGIESDARSAQSKLRNAFKTANNRHTVSLGDRQLLKGADRYSLSAANCYARIRWGEAVCADLAAFFCDDPQMPHHNQELHFVTLTDVACVTLVSAQDVSINFIAQRLRNGLRGMSYVAVIEPALYVNLQVGVRFQGKRCLSWHLHAVVWGLSKKEIKARIETLNASGRFRALAPGLDGAHSTVIEQGTLPQVIGYMLKPPVNGYRISRYDIERDGDPVINDDGEVQAKFIQGKAKLRPGERVSLFHAMKHLHLDQLTIAGGQGVPLLQRAKRKALVQSR